MRQVLFTIVVIVTTLVTPVNADTVVLKCAENNLKLYLQLDYGTETMKFSWIESDLKDQVSVKARYWGRTELYFIHTSEGFHESNLIVTLDSFYLHRISKTLIWHHQTLEPKSNDTRISEIVQATCEPIDGRSF